MSALQRSCGGLGKREEGCLAQRRLQEGELGLLSRIRNISNQLILCRPLLLLPSILPSIRVFSSELALLHSAQAKSKKRETFLVVLHCPPSKLALLTRIRVLLFAFQSILEYLFLYYVLLGICPNIYFLFLYYVQFL